MRVYSYGYRYGEIPLPKIGEIKDNVKFSPIRPFDELRRPVVAVSLGCHYHGAALPRPDLYDPITAAAGCRKRIASKHSIPQRRLLRALKKFVRRFCRKHLDPLSPDSDISFETWIERTPYSEKRKLELKQKWNKLVSILDQTRRGEKTRECNCFVKDEPYTDWKHARGIYSRSDEFKCAVGPIFKLIEDVVYELTVDDINPFIKHVPVAERPKTILAGLSRAGAKYVATDYTAFESQFTREIMLAVEVELYMYMTQKLPNFNEFSKLLLTVLAGTNKCRFKFFSVVVEATRMSGEMCTSLGNGFSNYMFMLFTASRVGCRHVRGFVEGDDGIFSMMGTPPTTKDFAELGLTIKLDVHTDLSEASFCGIIFHEIDLINITDPIKVLLSFGWTGQQYKSAKMRKLCLMLRAKALSYAHQYPGCPIVSEMAHWALRVTRWVRADMERFLQTDRTLDYYQRDKLLEAMRDENKLHRTIPGFGSRELMFRKFGIPPSVQLDVETYFQTSRVIEPMSIPSLEAFIPNKYREYSTMYTMKADYRNATRLDYPPLVFRKYQGFELEFDLKILKSTKPKRQDKPIRPVLLRPFATAV